MIRRKLGIWSAAARVALRKALMVSLLTSALPAPVLANGALDVWLGPDNGSPDMLDMFRQPEAWTKARSQIKVMKFGFQQLEKNFAGSNTYADLKSVDAFKKMRDWGIMIASGEGAIKEWDCTGLKAAKVTARHIGNVAEAGAALDLIGMDEPLIAGTRSCKLSIDEIASRTIVYIRAVESSPEAKRAGSLPQFGDTEAYPATSVDTIKQWILALKNQGFTPAFFHLDIAGRYLTLHKEFDMPGDVRKLADFFQKENIPFGIILWSGFDPLTTDKEYYDRTMAFIRTIKSSIGKPDQAVFQSWITRAPAGCQGPGPSCQVKDCKPSDGPLCGKRTIPLNLPESGLNVFSHTRLVNDGMMVLRMN